MIGNIAKVSLVVGCLAYLLWDIDLRQLVAALATVSPPKIVLILAVSFVSYGMLAARLSMLSHGQARIRDAFAASMVCLGVNNILPAKLGEVAKMVYLHRQRRVPFSEAAVIVGWERFFDLNFLVVLALASAYPYLHDSVLLPMAAGVLAAWSAAWWAIRNPQVVHRWLEYLPWQSLRRFLIEMHGHLDARMVRGSLLLTLLLSILVWSSYGLSTVLMLLWGFEYGLSVNQALVVFVLAASGMALPSSPGALGVYEAAVVLSLGWFGIAKEEALAAALVMHAMQYLPTTLIGLWVLSRTPIRLDRLHAR